MSYKKLRGKIREKFGTQEAFAEALNVHPTTLSKKLSNKSEWTRQEIEDASRLLEVPGEEIHAYFFAV